MQAGRQPTTAVHRVLNLQQLGEYGDDGGSESHVVVGGSNKEGPFVVDSGANLGRCPWRGGKREIKHYAELCPRRATSRLPCYWSLRHTQLCHNAKCRNPFNYG